MKRGSKCRERPNWKIDASDWERQIQRRWNDAYAAKECRWCFLVRFFFALILILGLVLYVALLLTRDARAADMSVSQRGKASWYWQPQKLSCGGRLMGRADTRMYAASHRFPCGARVRVTYGARSVDVTVMDTGPFIKGRVIDLFPAPAKVLGMTGRGVVSVMVETAQ